MMLSRIVMFILLATVCVAQDAGRMDEIVRSYVASRQFMGTALVARGDQVIFSKGYGSANLEWDIANSPNTKFRLGSVTKQFTAASILLLEERGKLAVQDPVKKYLPSAPAAWEKVTIEHLLTHTSGIPNFTGFADYPKLRANAAIPLELVARFRDRPLESEPGEKWTYSNSGYVLLSYLIEKITGDTYEKFVTENIFTPLRMTASGYDSNFAVIPQRASGYIPSSNGYRHADFIHMSIPHGAGALYSTTEDLLKWEQGLFGGKLLKPESLEKMTRPFKNNYAYGLVVETVGGRKIIHHGGGIEGFNTKLDYYPDDKLTVAVLGNVNGRAPEEIAKKLAAVAQGIEVKLQSERKEIAVDPKVLRRYAGAYRLQPGSDVLITLEGNQLVSKLTNQAPVPIFPESETRFFQKAVDAQIEFPRSEGEEKASQLIVHQNGRDVTAKRLSDDDARKLAEAAAATAQRFQAQTAVPGSEAALRRLIEELRTGKPDYARMSAGLATATRQQLPNLQAALTQLGAVQSVTFKGVNEAGGDIYEVKFEKGSLEYRLWLAPGGMVESAMVRPL